MPPTVQPSNFCTVQRRWPESLSLIGEMLIAGKHECYTLEPPQKTDGSKPRAIPAGTYDLTIRFSPHFARLMPHVENVPGFDGVLVHWGNFAKDTEGCTLVGDLMANNFVGHSVVEFGVLFQKLQDALAIGPQTITYIDPVPFLMAPDDGEIST
jgi:Family of unknown function (DUF5675)